MCIRDRARLGARAVKFIPGIGSAIGGITLAVLSGGSTYAIGEVFKKHFETGGTFLDFDPQRLKKYYDEKFEKGKKMARDMEKDEKQKHDDKASKPTASESTPDSGIKDLVAQLESIQGMRDKGVLTEEEFETLKKKILAAQSKLT